MNIPEHWGRMAAIAFDDEAQAGAVWIANSDRGELTLYDSCLFGDLPLERVAEALRARGKHATAWEAGTKAVADRLMHEGGVYMIADPVTEDDAMAAMLSRDLADRLKRERFFVGERETEWRREYDAWRRSEAPVATTPLLRATRLVLARLEYARPRAAFGKSQPNAPKIAIV